MDQEPRQHKVTFLQNATKYLFRRRAKKEAIEDMFFETTRKNAEQFLLRRLKQRAVEAIQEKDKDLRGARTILTWLQSDMDCFQAMMIPMAAVSASKGRDNGWQLQVDEILGKLLLKVKAILVNGTTINDEDLSDWQLIEQIEQHSALFVEYYALKLSASEFCDRFLAVGKQIYNAYQEIAGIGWSEKRYGE
jgi:hypothetical protein